ncbi:MAG TPA: DUF3152 domain-containing protein [Streptomyces sp.]|nr:DUF3152 domain-containing protein [Streptomyces sp.]
MGRHSRRGPAPKRGTAETSGTAGTQASSGAKGTGSGARGKGRGRAPADGAEAVTPAPRTRPAPAAPAGQGGGWPPDGTPARGGDAPRFPDGTPVHGVPRFPGGTPAQGVPGSSGGTPAHGVPQVRGGHPEQHEGGGGWGGPDGRTGAGYGAAGPLGASGAPGVPGPSGVPIPRQRHAPPAGPRPEYLEAFDEDEDDVFAASASRPGRSASGEDAADARTLRADGDGGDGDVPPAGGSAQARGGKGRTFTGIAAAAVTTVLAVVVAGQVADGADGSGPRSRSSAGHSLDADDSAPGDARPAPLTYEQQMSRTYPLGAELKGSGKFEAVAGLERAPGKGRKFRYRVDVEEGLGLDAELFARAVQKTLNDERSWAHNGARTFERVHSGDVDFVITLASPGTTADWCARSGLDTTVDNVSCDSAATQRVMVNAYRWAQGSGTFGDDSIHAYRQMLINHEVGHRLGYGHVTCDKKGDLAPVMQQQTKFLEHDGIRCLPNAWPYPGR